MNHLLDFIIFSLFYEETFYCYFVFRIHKKILNKNSKLKKRRFERNVYFEDHILNTFT